MVLIVETDGQGRFRIALHPEFYGPGLDDIHRALAANIMGIDWPMYGGNLEPILLGRLDADENGLVEYLQSEVISKLNRWENQAAAMKRIKATSVAMSMLAVLHMQPSQMWTYNGRLLAIDRAEAATITDQDYSEPPASGWESRTNLRASLPVNNRNVVHLAKAAQLKPGERSLHRTGNAILDVYYAPDAAKRIRAVAA